MARCRRSEQLWRLRWLGGALALVMLVLLAAPLGREAASAAPAQAASFSVDIRDYAFSPDSLTVSVGDTVTWTNRDVDVHTSTSGAPFNPDGLWESGILNTGQSYARTFDAPGTFPYFCAVHPFMKGTMVVQGTAQATATSVAPTPIPTATTAPSPTPTPTVAPIPTSAATATPSPTPQRTPSPAPGGSPLPTFAPNLPSPTPSLTAVPQPSPTPERAGGCGRGAAGSDLLTLIPVVAVLALAWRRRRQ
ncbi:MAG: cupredoxin domain-containing protein [Chloroflexi bacterium]|nr:cupredoxin domain-containing protein [Chloroflexota bacterium]